MAAKAKAKPKSPPKKKSVPRVKSKPKTKPKASPRKKKKPGTKTGSAHRHFTTDEIILALKKTKGLVSLAAEELNCSINTIYQRIEDVKKVRG